MLVTSLFGNDEDNDGERIERGGEGADTTSEGHTDDDATSAARARERRARKQYSWMRRVPNRRYNVYNLDVVDKGEYSKNVGILKRSFAGDL